jgi:penicillin amidase
MIVELGQKTTAHVVLPGGQSGDPSSRYYDDSMQKWINGEYHEIDLSRSKESIFAQKLCSLTLQTK